MEKNAGEWAEKNIRFGNDKEYIIYSRNKKSKSFPWKTRKLVNKKERFQQTLNY